MVGVARAEISPGGWHGVLQVLAALVARCGEQGGVTLQPQLEHTHRLSYCSTLVTATTPMAFATTTKHAAY